MLNDAGLPTVLIGVVLVLLVAASVSTLASITITASSTLTMDLLKERFFSEAGYGGHRPCYQGPLCLFVLLSYVIANSPYAYIGYDVLFLGYSVRQLSGSVRPFALLEGDQPHGRLGGDAGGLYYRRAALWPPSCFFRRRPCPSLASWLIWGPISPAWPWRSPFLLCWVFSLCWPRRPSGGAQENPGFYAEEETA